MVNWVSGLRSICLNLFFPKNCEHCGNSFEDGLSNVLCRSCFNSISPYEDPVCEHCGVSLPAHTFEDAVKTRCRDCGEEPYNLDRVRAFGAYGGPLRIAHHVFKFEGMESLADEIAKKMAAATIPAFWQGVEALAPVPLSPEKERERGYNPSAHLAAELSKTTGIPVRGLLKKIRSTATQMSLSREARLKNPKGAYQMIQGEVPSRVVLVDDVFTTGATLEECAKVLKKAGVNWVGALVFGRTPRY